MYARGLDLIERIHGPHQLALECTLVSPALALRRRPKLDVVEGLKARVLSCARRLDSCAADVRHRGLETKPIR